MNKHENYITHMDNPEDVVHLRTKLIPVNMRLFKTSPEYYDIIRQQCDYIRFLCSTQMEGYKKPHGMSSANAGLGHNIIGVIRNRNKSDEYCQIMINPVITNYGKNNEMITESNCGSLTLPEPINIERRYDVVVEWFDEDGVFHNERITPKQAGLSVQHETDHNNGILIIDREVK